MDVTDIKMNKVIYNNDRRKRRSIAAPTHSVNIESVIIGTPSRDDILQALIDGGINVGELEDKIQETTSDSLELKLIIAKHPNEPVGLTGKTSANMLIKIKEKFGNLTDVARLSGSNLSELRYILGEPVVDAVNQETPIFVTADLCRGNDHLYINPLFTLNTNASEVTISVYGLTNVTAKQTHIIVNQKTNDVLLKIDDTSLFRSTTTTFFVYVNRTTYDDYGIVPVTLTNSMLCDSYKRAEEMVQTDMLQVEVPYVVACINQTSIDRFKRELQYRAVSVFGTNANVDRVTVLDFREEQKDPNTPNCTLRVIDVQVIYCGNCVTYIYGNITEYIKRASKLLENHMNTAWKTTQTDESGEKLDLMKVKKILLPMSNGDIQEKAPTSVVAVSVGAIIGISVYFAFHFGGVITGTHLMYWRYGGSIRQRLKVLTQGFFIAPLIVSIIIQSLSFVDYSNMMGVTNPSGEIKIALVVLVMLNVLTLIAKMYLFMRHCILDKQFYDKYEFINPVEPTSLFQLKIILPLILHDNIFRCVNYFYVIRYRPVNLQMSIYTFLLMPLELVFAFLPLTYSLINRTRDKKYMLIGIINSDIVTVIIWQFLNVRISSSIYESISAIIKKILTLRIFSPIFNDLS